VEKYNQILDNQFELISTLEFTRDRKSMSSFCLDKNSKKEIMFIKGAPERIVQKASSLVNKSGETVPLNARNKEELLKNVKELAKQGLRCLAIAVKFDCGVLKGFDGKNKSHPGYAHLEDYTKYGGLEEDPILLGIVAMQDPPRPEVRASIEKCKRAGISVVVSF
jgi:Ca2+-transporting ATPase